jgi:hypothetical protein
MIAGFVGGIKNLLGGQDVKSEINSFVLLIAEILAMAVTCDAVSTACTCGIRIEACLRLQNQL